MVLVILVILNALAGRLRLHLQNYSFLLMMERKTRTLIHVLRRFAYERAKTTGRARRCLRGRICTVSGLSLRARTMAGALRCLRGRICAVSGLRLCAKTTGRARRCLREQEGSGKTERLRAKTMAGALHCLRGRVDGELGKEEVLKKGGTVVGGAGAWTSGGKKGGKCCWRYRRLYLQRHWGTEPALTPRFAVLTDAISRFV